MASINNLSIFMIVITFVTGNVLSQCFFKYGILQLHNDNGFVFSCAGALFIVGGLSMQIIGLGCWLLILKYKDLAWAGLMASLIPVSLVLTGKYVFNENIDNITMLGLVIVVLGLVIVNSSALYQKL